MHNGLHNHRVGVALNQVISFSSFTPLCDETSPPLSSPTTYYEKDLSGREKRTT
jgi:hypothetical protein